MSKQLFPKAEALGVPPPKKHDDLSMIRVIDRDSPEGIAILASREARRARLEAAGLDMTQVALLGKLTKGG